MEMMMEIKNLSKAYGTFLLDHISLSLPKGIIMGMIGENGAGKTTLIRLILNLTAKDSGKVEILGMDSQKEEMSIKQQVGVVLDDCFFHESLRAEQIGRMMEKIYESWQEKLFSHYLKQFQIPLDKQIKNYSKGMKMKLSLAVALSHDAKLLILDEALNGLDPVVRDEMLDVFMDFISDGEHSIFLSSHITSDLEKIVDYVTFLHEGRLVLCEEKDVLLGEYGILKCAVSDFHKIQAQDLIRVNRGKYNCQALIKNRGEAQMKYPDMVVDKATLENIMLFTIKGEKQ